MLTGRRIALVLTALTALVTGPGLALAQDSGSQLDSIVIMNGTCKHLLVGGHDETPSCLPKVVNETFKTGRTGFTFTVGDVAVISFSGMGPRQVKLSPDKVSQPLDHVLFTLLGMGSATKVNRVPATGTCVYTNPYAGPALVSCRAHTSHRDFAATFVSDGQEPAVRRF